MAVHITSNMGRYTRRDASHYQVGDDGTLRIFVEGKEVLTYAPGSWHGVEVEPVRRRARGHPPEVYAGWVEVPHPPVVATPGSDEEPPPMPPPTTTYSTVLAAELNEEKP